MMLSRIRVLDWVMRICIHGDRIKAVDVVDRTVLVRVAATMLGRRREVISIVFVFGFGCNCGGERGKRRSCTLAEEQSI
jgi:hypothetical protein